MELLGVDVLVMLEDCYSQILGTLDRKFFVIDQKFCQVVVTVFKAGILLEQVSLSVHYGHTNAFIRFEVIGSRFDHLINLF